MLKNTTSQGQDQVQRIRNSEIHVSVAVVALNI